MTDLAVSTHPMDNYNGWVNRETWAVALHLANDYDVYHQARDLIADKRSDVAAGEALADWIGDCLDRIYFSSNNNNWVCLMASDLHSLGRVDWAAVATSLRDE